MRASRGSKRPSCAQLYLRTALAISLGGCFGLVIELGLAKLFPAEAATTTTSFVVRMTIQAFCSIRTNPLPFPQYSGAADTATTTLTITCTNGTIYNVGLDPGTAPGATVTTRKVTSGANTLNYALFSNVGRTSNWGQTVGTDTVSGTGNGVAQTLTIYGTVPGAQIVAPGTYTDNIIATVSY